jgi:glycogen operon protein
MVDGPKDLAWLHPDGREMSEDDWHDSALQTVGMFLSGKPLREPGPRGEQLIDASFLVWFHAGEKPVEVHLPENDWVTAGEVVVSTDPDLPAGTAVEAEAMITLGGRCVVVLQEQTG